MVAAIPTGPNISFRLGQIVATPGALAAMEKARQQPTEFIARHARGDWGEVDAEDGRANNEAVAHEGDPDRQARVLSSYRTSLAEKIWIITEWDRSVTTILLPYEY